MVYLFNNAINVGGFYPNKGELIKMLAFLFI